MKKHFFFTAFLFFLFCSSAFADVKLASVFNDNMVLQRDRAVQIFGKADAGEIVTVRFANQTKKTTADKDGKWRVNLEVMKANATPTSLIVEGKNKIEIKTYSLAKWDVRGAVEYGFQTWRFFERKRNSRES